MIKLIMYTMSILCIASFCDCNSSKGVKKEGAEVIKIGSGGGFAGKEMSLIIHDDGSLSSSTGDHYKKIKKEVLSQLLSNIAVLGIDKLDYNLPSNLYQFVEIKSGSDTKRLAWDPQSPEVPSSLKLFYNNINNIFKNSKK
ncbi:MAG: hypothetical protein ABIO44_00625 [Saprospiraceae bacterium]